MKTFLVALFCCVRAILYPGSLIKVASNTQKQARELVTKITEGFMHQSPMLRNEIEKWSTGQNDCYIMFKNGSILRVVVAGENARGGRSNILIIDESRMIKQKIVDKILRPMNAAPRQPGYLSNPKYEHLKEMNKEIYMSSCWYKGSEMYEKVLAYTANMLDPNLKYFVCALPYQLSIQEGLLMREQIMNEMSEATFDEISFLMERGCLFWGAGQNSFFDYKNIDKTRILTDAFYKLDYYRENNVSIPKHSNGEIRTLSVDIALLASKKHDNDASAFIINCAVPTSSHDMISNIKFVDTKEGLVTEELGLTIMRYYYQYDCDYLVIDANGVGTPVLDYLMCDRYDPMYGTTYAALNVCNNDDLASRCKVSTAKKVIFAIKANQKSNNDMVIALRAGFQNGNINLLVQDNIVEPELAKNIKGYSKMSEEKQMELIAPYVQTSYLVEELVKLEYSVQGGMIKVNEVTGMRKDRFSSLEYNYWVTQELARELKPKTDDLESLLAKMTIKKANYGFGIKF